MRFKEFRNKEVINIATGKCIGYVIDIDIDVCTGCVKSIFVPGPGKIGGLLGRDTLFCIEWKSIVRIGPDIILVNICELHGNK